MSQLTTNTAIIDELITMANNLPDAGSGGEDVSAETAEYTELLTDLETAIDALPDAGGGGGGSVLETCTVTFGNSNNLVVSFAGLNEAGDGINTDMYSLSSETTIQVIKNTIVTIFDPDYARDFSATTATGAVMEAVYANHFVLGCRITDTVAHIEFVYW